MTGMSKDQFECEFIIIYEVGEVMGFSFTKTKSFKDSR
jgi:hypothetical protein